MPEAQSRWQGECFVFDERVSVGHGLREGQHVLCRSCRDPLREVDVASPLFELGVSGPRCHDKTSDEKKAGHRERQRQVELAKARRTPHHGAQRVGSRLRRSVVETPDSADGAQSAD